MPGACRACMSFNLLARVSICPEHKGTTVQTGLLIPVTLSLCGSLAFGAGSFHMQSTAVKGNGTRRKHVSRQESRQ